MVSWLIAAFSATVMLLLLFGGTLALYRLLPKASRVEDHYEILVRLDALERQFTDFARQYELAVRSFRTQRGKLERRLREAGEDLDDDDDQPDAAPDQAAADDQAPLAFPNTKAELRRKAGLI